MAAPLNRAERQRLIDRLHAERCSCVIRNGEQTRTFNERGVKDLYRLLTEEPELLRGAFVADKVVGKGAAALMILGSVEEVYTDVASTAALELFAAWRGGGMRPRSAADRQPRPHGPLSGRNALSRLPHGRRVPGTDTQLHTE